MLFKYAQTCIKTNGFVSKYFNISRSYRQGCPIAPLVYILRTEPVACTIRRDSELSFVQAIFVNLDLLFLADPIYILFVFSLLTFEPEAFSYIHVVRISKDFLTDSSYRQGCPIAPLVYILRTEPVACTIRRDSEVQGVKLPFVFSLLTFEPEAFSYIHVVRISKDFLTDSSFLLNS
jgi:hypothetical protein